MGSLQFVTDLHRWLAFEGKQQSTAKEITTDSNFLFLIILEAYLRLPHRFRWSSLKPSLFFKKKFN